MVVSIAFTSTYALALLNRLIRCISLSFAVVSQIIYTLFPYKSTMLPNWLFRLKLLRFKSKVFLKENSRLSITKRSFSYKCLQCKGKSKVFSSPSYRLYFTNTMLNQNGKKACYKQNKRTDAIL